MNITHRSRKGGFTLIELLIVIAIIAILTGIIITGLVGSRAKSRDAKRASDLSQISLALEQYFDRCDQYPFSDGKVIDANTLYQNSGCPKDASGAQINFGYFISVVPTDPSTGNAYAYITNTDVLGGTYPQPTDYVLATTFESSNSVLAQSAPNPTWMPTSIFNCTNGLDYCVRPN